MPPRGSDRGPCATLRQIAGPSARWGGAAKSDALVAFGDVANAGNIISQRFERSDVEPHDFHCQRAGNKPTCPRKRETYLKGGAGAIAAAEYRNRVDGILPEQYRATSDQLGDAEQKPGDLSRA